MISQGADGPPTQRSEWRGQGRSCQCWRAGSAKCRPLGRAPGKEARGKRKKNSTAELTLTRLKFIWDDCNTRGACVLLSWWLWMSPGPCRSPRHNFLPAPSLLFFSTSVVLLSWWRCPGVLGRLLMSWWTRTVELLLEKWGPATSSRKAPILQTCTLARDLWAQTVSPSPSVACLRCVTSPQDPAAILGSILPKPGFFT